MRTFIRCALSNMLIRYGLALMVGGTVIDKFLSDPFGFYIYLIGGVLFAITGGGLPTYVTYLVTCENLGRHHLESHTQYFSLWPSSHRAYCSVVGRDLAIRDLQRKQRSTRE